MAKRISVAGIVEREAENLLDCTEFQFQLVGSRLVGRDNGQVQVVVNIPDSRSGVVAYRVLAQMANRPIDRFMVGFWLDCQRAMDKVGL